jgi:hypothetical protein
MAVLFTREVPLPQHHLARHHEQRDATRFRAVYDRVDHRGIRAQIRLGDLPPRQQNQIGRLARLESSDVSGVRCGPGAALGGHAQHLRARGNDSMSRSSLMPASSRPMPTRTSRAAQ